MAERVLKETPDGKVVEISETAEERDSRRKVAADRASRRFSLTEGQRKVLTRSRRDGKP